jgi:beta-phosphoglucomutase
MAVLAEIKRRDVKVAIGSSSRNTPTIIEKIGLANAFKAIADGNQITLSKPNPEVFLLAASKLGIPPEKCAVVEDAEAGIEAALRAGMRAIGVGSAVYCSQAHIRASTFADLDVDELLA